MTETETSGFNFVENEKAGIKKKFIRMLSHEFNNTLIPIYSGSQYAIQVYKNMLKKYKNILPRKFLEYLEMIHNGSKKLKNLINKYISENS
ncbi:MAG: hypothetical protein ACTSPD_05490 [Promethearchaeota archaeon]